MDVLKEILLKEAEIEGISFDYIGTLPKRGVFFLGSNRSSSLLLRDLYISSLEAALNGFEVVTLSSMAYTESILRGALDGGGKAHVVFLNELDRAKRSIISITQILGGSSIFPYREKVSFKEFYKKAGSISSVISNITVLADDYDKKYEDEFYSRIISNHSYVGVLKTSLRSKLMRRLVREGCDLISSFSDLLLRPRFSIYPKDGGYYNFKGEGFEALDYERFER